MGGCLSSPAEKGAGSNVPGGVANDHDGGAQQTQKCTGLGHTNLIFALDFSKSSRSASLGRTLLHSLGDDPNPYEQVMTAITNVVYGASNSQQASMHAMGFGDSTTQDMSVFGFYNGDVPAAGLEALLSRYRELVPCVKAANLISFAPAIYQGMRVVVDSGCKHHTLVIITSSPVTHAADLAREQYGRQELATVNAIVAASQVPLSIIVVGLCDKLGESMQRLCEKLPERSWDNFRFIQFPAAHEPKTEAALTSFAAQTLSGIPNQMKTVCKLGLVGCAVAIDTNVRSLPPPTIQLEATAKGSLLVSNPSGSSDATASSAVSQQKSATAFERWADSAQTPGKPSASQGLILPRAPGAAGPSPFSTWVANSMPKAPQSMEPLPEIGMAQYGPHNGQHPTYAMPPNGMDMMQAGGHYGTSGEGSGFGMMPLGPMGMLSQDVMHHGLGQQLGGMSMLPLASDPIHHGRQQQGAALGMMPLSSDPIHHGRQQQGAGMGMMPPLNDALHHGLQQQQQQQQQQMGLMPPDMHRGLPPQMSMQPSMQPLMQPSMQASRQPPMQPPMPSAGVAEVAYEDDLYVDEQFICPLGGKIMRDPVMACDGRTYDRDNITEWLQSHDTSPTTEQVLLHKELTPDHQLKASIAEFLAGMNQPSGRRYLH